MKKLIMIVVMALVTLFTSNKTEAKHFHHRRVARPVVIREPVHPPVCKEVIIVKPRREVVIIKQRPIPDRRFHRERVYRHR